MTIVAADKPATTDRAVKTVKIDRTFSDPTTAPYDQVQWVRHTIEQKNWKTGEVIFTQHDVEFPEFWSLNAATIVTTKYFRGAVGSPDRETSLRQVIDRVVDRYTDAALANGYVTEPGRAVFADELRWLLLHQFFSFNSPVWFNVGTSSPQQVSACFILAVDDTMDSILNWYREEGLIFKGGSGAGLNLSRIRSSKELLRGSGGTASGPVSFMRGADASAGTIKSGGATRRAAKMVVLDIDHPDIEQFIQTKAREEDKIRALRDAGFDMDLGGEDITSVQYQNANNSVRVSDLFMTAVEDGGTFDLLARTDGRVIETVDAKALYAKVVQAAWECADPGIQYNDTINAWHTTSVTGPITASNPCSEYMSLDNTSCNLASLNLMKFLRPDDTFDTAKFIKAVEIVITAMEISISFADFPTEAIGANTRDFRQLGIGYANLGGLLMSKGLAYDSVEGRALAGAITSLMTGVSYRRSAEIAAVVGPYNGYEVNAEPHKNVMYKHRAASSALRDELRGVATGFVARGIVTKHDEAAAIADAAHAEWVRGIKTGEKYGWRNAQASVLAPTGTIGLMMDCDTTGVEPDLALVKFKKLVGGGSMQIINRLVPRALRNLGYNEDVISATESYVIEHGTIVGAPDIDEKHYDVFDCAMGDRPIKPMGHVRMMAAAQPFLSGAISKTVNLNEDATPDDIADVYLQGWRLGLKALAVYRDNCKVGQPLSNSKGTDNKAPEANTVAAVATTTEATGVEIRYVTVPMREKLPRERTAKTVSFQVGDAEGYLTCGEYTDGRLGEVFLKMSKQGSTLAGMMDAFSVAISIGLQSGVPLETFVAKYTNQRFEPSGMTDDPNVRMAQSIIDYIFRYLAIAYLPFDVRSAYGIFTTAERTASVNGGGYGPVEDEPTPDQDGIAKDVTPVAGHPVASSMVEVDQDLKVTREKARKQEKPVCATCQVDSFMKPAGACWICTECGGSTGCS